MPKGWLMKWPAAIGEVLTCSREPINVEKISLEKLYSFKIFSYLFFVRKYFYNEIKVNYGMYISGLYMYVILYLQQPQTWKPISEE